MKDNLINNIQKFINSPFKYSDLLIFLDKQKDFLLQESILDKTEECEYNAIWDTIMDLQKVYEFANKSNLIIGTKYSVLTLFNYNYKCRTESKKTIV